MAILINIVISFVLSLIVGVIAKVTKLKIYDIFTTIYALFLLIPGIAQEVRRMHDVYVLLDLIPIVGWILVLVAVCSPSVVENNNYGVQL